MTLPKAKVRAGRGGVVVVGGGSSFPFTRGGEGGDRRGDGGKCPQLVGPPPTLSRSGDGFSIVGFGSIFITNVPYFTR